MAQDPVHYIKEDEQKVILDAVHKAIDLAAEDAGLEKQSYGMLEERIRWYLEEMREDLGYELDIIFNQETFVVEIHEIRILPSKLSQGETDE